MIVKMLPVGPIQANCFIIGCEDTREAVVIDPGGDADQILMLLAELKLTVKYIINTHGHFDHVCANKRMKEVTGADILIHPLDAPMLSHVSTSGAMFGLSGEDSPPADRTLEDGDVVSFGKNINLKVIHTPGHSPGGISLYTEGMVFVGDTLFAGSVGRTDFPGGDFNVLRTSIQEKLFVLGDEVKVYPGHMSETTIKIEKLSNPFVHL